MFLLQNASGQVLHSIARQHRNRRLGNDWSRIHLLCDQMNGTAVQLNPGCQGTRMRFKTWE